MGDNLARLPDPVLAFISSYETPSQKAFGAREVRA